MLTVLLEQAKVTWFNHKGATAMTQPTITTNNQRNIAVFPARLEKSANGIPDVRTWYINIFDTCAVNKSLYSVHESEKSAIEGLIYLNCYYEAPPVLKEGYVMTLVITDSGVTEVNLEQKAKDLKIELSSLDEECIYEESKEQVSDISLVQSITR